MAVGEPHLSWFGALSLVWLPAGSAKLLRREKSSFFPFGLEVNELSWSHFGSAVAVADAAGDGWPK